MRQTNEMYTGATVEDIQPVKLTRWQKIKQFFRGDLAGASNWLGKAWGIDLSRYQTVANIPEGSIDFAIAKMGGSEYSDGARLDVMFAQHIDAIYKAKAIPMAYWYVDSSYYTKRGHSLGDLPKFTNANHPILKVIVEGMRAGNGWKYVKALFFDVETAGAGDVWNAAYCEDLRDRIVEMQRAGTFPNIPLGVYSRQSFVITQPAFGNWVAEHPELIIWTANYLKAFPGTYKPLVKHKTETLPTVHAPIWFGDNAAKPKKYARAWQYHGSFDGAMFATCPEILGGAGTPSALDLNVWEIYDRAGLHAALNVPDRLIVIDPEPDPEPDPDLTALTARVVALEAQAHAKDHTHTTGGPV
jgi:hypothetical protein